MNEKVVSINSEDLLYHYLKPIKHLFDLEGVTEIWINRYDDIFIRKLGERIRVNDVAFENEGHVATLVKQIANVLDQEVHPERNPVLDARLPDGNRVCAVLSPASTRGSMIAIRIFPKQRITARFLLDQKSLIKEMLDFIRVAMSSRASGLIVGGTGSGKTTLLNVACDYIPDTDRLVTVEDTHELQSDIPNRVHLEAPKRRQKDNGQVVDMPYLIKTSLRLDPTRIVVGEIRDGEAAAAFLRAINTGHCACSTIHANSPEDALTRIQTEVAGHTKLPFDVVRAQVRANLDFLVYCEDTSRHGRRVVSISEIVDQQVVELWYWDYDKGEHVKTGHEPQLYRNLSKYGIKL